MPRPLPVTGRWEDGHEHKENHEKHFGAAIQDALDQWADSSEADDYEASDLKVEVTLEATITPNPGGIKEYRATIKG